MVHAQDHLMTSILARDLIEEMIGMLKEQSEAKTLQ
jgi:PTS system cellobiose-specific IIA component